MTPISMPLPPRARKSAPIVKEGHEHLQQTSDIIHQHRLSLASQIRKFDARWASLFNLAPVLNKLTKGRQMPNEFRDNARDLRDDVQVALQEAHSRKLPRIPEESLVPGPPPPRPIIGGRSRSLMFSQRHNVVSGTPSEKPSIVVRVRSKLRRKRAVKQKGSRKGLARFNPFRSKAKTEVPTTEQTPEAPPLNHKPSRRTMRSGGSSRSGRRSARHKKSASRLSEKAPTPPTPLAPMSPEFKPFLPPPPNFSPLKVDMTSIGQYSPQIMRSPVYHPTPWLGAGSVNPSITPSSPQPYYLNALDPQEVKGPSQERRRRRGGDKGQEKTRDKERKRSSSRHRDRSRDRDSKEDRPRRRRRRRHDTSRDHEREKESRRRDRSPRRDYHDDDGHPYSKRDKHSETDSPDSRRPHRHRHRRRDDYYDEKPRDRYISPSYTHPAATYPHSYRSPKRTHYYEAPLPELLHQALDPSPQVVERSRFKENFSMIQSTT
ncbi:hypothetical protein PM082_001951 [Marasmius tenuissimus]|nr:hypothetical protein PM082_001951 [Marasmius tenuissimus]